MPTDVDTTDGTFLVSKVVMGADVSIYVTEGHTICGVRVSIDVSYTKVTETTVGVS